MCDLCTSVKYQSTRAEINELDITGRKSKTSFALKSICNQGENDNIGKVNVH